MTGISGTSKTACFVSGGPPDNSMSVYRSYDEHFRDTEREFVNASIPIDMLMSLAMESNTTGVVGGLGLLEGGTWYTDDGKNFQQSEHEFGLFQTQAVCE